MKYLFLVLFVATCGAQTPIGNSMTTNTMNSPDPYKHIKPTPEPETYGLIFVGVSLTFLAYKKFKRPHSSIGLE